MSEKGANWEAVYQSVSPKTWMIWVKLNCLKSSGKLETSAPSIQRLRSSPDSSILKGSSCEILLSGTVVSETYQATKGHPKSS
jgi:hypothetical protein